MDAPRIEIAERISRQAAELDGDARDTFIRDACGGDHHLRELVTALARGDPSASFLGEPLLDPDAEPAESHPGTEFEGRTIGRYTIERIIGSGAAGTVYRAVQARTNQVVAFKLLRRDVNEIVARRLRREGELLGRLRHRAIAQVHDADEHTELHDGIVTRLPYIAMEYVVDAKDILTYADARGLDREDRFELFRTVCAGVAHANGRGIIHRDLNPANILVDGHGNAKIIDFGIARALDTPAGLHTAHIDFEGSLPWAAPEAFEGDLHDLDNRSDVYSLGAILYRLICGRHPYTPEVDNFAGWANVVTRCEPVKPSSFDPSVDRETERVLLAAIRKDREKRYDTAGELAEDIRRLLEGEPLKVAHLTISYLLGRQIRRNPWRWASAGLAIVAVLALSLGSVMWWVLQNTSSALSRARAAEARISVIAAERAAALERAEEAELNQRLVAYGSTMTAAAAAMQSGDVGTARRALDSTDPGLRGFEWDYLSANLPDGIDPAPIMSVPDIRLIVDGDVIVDPQAGERALGTLAIAAHARGTLVGDLIRDATGAVALHDFHRVDPGNDHAWAVAFLSPDYVLIGGREEQADRHHVAIWDISVRTAPQRLAMMETFSTSWVIAAVPREGEGLFAFEDGGDVVFHRFDRDTRDCVEVARLPGLQEGLVSRITFDPTGELMATCHGDYAARVWNLDAILDSRDSAPLAVFRHRYHVPKCAFSPDGRMLLTASVDGTARFWDVAASIDEHADWLERGDPEGAQGVEVGRTPRSEVPVLAIEMDAGSLRAAIAAGESMQVWEHRSDTIVPSVKRHRAWYERSTELVSSQSGHAAPIRWVTWLRDGSILSASEDGTVRRWVDEQPSPRLVGHLSSVFRAIPYADGRYGVSIGGREQLYLWDLPLRLATARIVFRPDEAPTSCDVFERLGRVLLAVGTNGRLWRGLYLYDVSDARKPVEIDRVIDDRTLDDKQHGYVDVRFSPDGSRLATLMYDGRAHIRTVGDDRIGDVEHSIDRERPQGRRIRFLDERHLVITTLQTGGGEVWSWDLESGRARTVHSGSAHGLVVSPDSSKVGYGLDDGTIVVHEVIRSNGGVTLGTATEIPNAHHKLIRALAFNPSDGRLYSGGDDAVIRAWDVDTRVCLATLRGHIGAVNDISFDPTGSTMLSASAGHFGDDNVAYVWNSRVDPDAQFKQSQMRRARREIRRLGLDRAVSLPGLRDTFAGDTRIPEPIRSLGLEHFDMLVMPPYWMMRHARNVARRPGLSYEAYSDAMTWSSAAIEAAPEMGSANAVHALLLYRLGRFDEAARSIEISRTICRGTAEVDDAIAALIALALDRVDEARRLRDKVDGTRKKPPYGYFSPATLVREFDELVTMRMRRD